MTFSPNIKNEKGVLLFSSGLDSFMLWRLLGMPKCVFVRLGHAYQEREEETVRYIQSKAKENGLDMEATYTDRIYLGDTVFPDGFIPYRNLLLLIVAAIEDMEADEIYLGALKGEANRDKSSKFFKDSSKLLSYMRKQKNSRDIKVFAPAQKYTKSQLVKEYVKHFPDDVYMLGWTRSCYMPDSKKSGCGLCTACFRRWIAMELNDIHEEYEVEPWKKLVSYWFGADTGRDDLKNRIRNLDVREIPDTLRNNIEATRVVTKAMSKATGKTRLQVARSLLFNKGKDLGLDINEDTYN